MMIGDEDGAPDELDPCTVAGAVHVDEDLDVCSGDELDVCPGDRAFEELDVCPVDRAFEELGCAGAEAPDVPAGVGVVEVAVLVAGAGVVESCVESTAGDCSLLWIAGGSEEAFSVTVVSDSVLLLVPA